jgi:hypothetical protein
MFIKNFSDIVRPLYDLTKKDIEFQWNEEYKQAFQRIRDAIVVDLVLILLDPRKPFEVETNVLDFAIGGQLSQWNENSKLYLVTFFLRKLVGL